MRILLEMEKEYARTSKTAERHHDKKYAMWGMMLARKTRKRFEKALEAKYSS